MNRDHGCRNGELSTSLITASTTSSEDPVRVKATVTKQPGQAAVSPMFRTILTEYPLESQLMAVSYSNNIVRAPTLHPTTGSLTSRRLLRWLRRTKSLWL